MNTYTPDEIRAARESRYTWYGYLAGDNIEHVGQRIRNLLQDRRYTFVSTNVEHKSAPPDVRTSQRLEPDKSTYKDGLHLYESHDKYDHWGLVASDSYGVWGLSTSFATEREAHEAARDPNAPAYKRLTSVVIEGGRTSDEVGDRSHIKISQYNGYGEMLHWVIAVEKGCQDAE